MAQSLDRGDLVARVIVIGGGWAGCSAAWRLAEAGWELTLLEKAPRLGGRSSSFFHRSLGVEVDCGQHLMLGAYDETRRLLSTLGEEDGVRFEHCLEIPYFTAGGVVRLRCPALPGPLSLAAGLLRFPWLEGAEKFQLLRLGLRAWRGLLQPDALGKLTAAQWLARCWQSPTLIGKFWEPLCLATLNTTLKEAPASLLAAVLRRGFLRGGKAAALGFPLKPLSQLLEPSLPRALQTQGGQVRLSCGVSALCAGKQGVRVELENRETLEADAAVVALPRGQAARLLKPGVLEDGGAGYSPILTAHVFTTEPFLPAAFGVFAEEEGNDPGFEFHWCFDRTRLFGARGPGGAAWTLFVASAARRMAGMGQEAVLLELWRQLARRLGSAFDPSQVLRAFVLKEAHATPLFEPGQKRPSQRTSLPNLVLAGDWTDTGLPATIEGAVLSGKLAAEALMAPVPKMAGGAWQGVS